MATTPAFLPSWLPLVGVDLGDVFKGIADIVGGMLKAAFDAFAAAVSVIVSIFSALNDVLSVFVDWIGTIGKELGKGAYGTVYKVCVDV